MPGLLLPKAALALCLLGVSAGPTLAQSYHEGAPRPRIGTRFFNFVKDLIDGDEPQARSHGYASSRSGSTRQHNYGARGGPKLNLDAPPPVAAYAPPTGHRPLPPPPVSRNEEQPPGAQEYDMPYSSPRSVLKESPDDPPAPAPVRSKSASGPDTEAHATPPAPKSSSTKSTASGEDYQTRPKDISPPVKKTDPQPSKSSPDVPVETQPRSIAPDSGSSSSSSSPTNSLTPRNADSGSSTPSSSSSSAPSGNATALTGTKTSKAGLVKSPYAPYNELDVSGLPSGSLAMDPTTGKVFRVP